MMLDCGCPADYPDWHDQDINLGGYSAHQLPIPMLFNMPLAYEAYLKRQQQTLDQLHLQERWPGLVLMRTGLFRGAITRLLEDSQSLSRHVQTLAHPFHIRAWQHEGNLSNARNAIRQIQMSLFDAGKKPLELYLSYLTCPHCAEGRGGEKMLLLRRWKENGPLQKRRRQT